MDTELDSIIICFYILALIFYGKGESVSGWNTVTRKRNRSELSLTPRPLSQFMSLMNMESDIKKPELPTNWSTLTESKTLDQVMKKLLVIDHIEEKVDHLIDMSLEPIYS